MYTNKVVDEHERLYSSLTYSRRPLAVREQEMSGMSLEDAEKNELSALLASELFGQHGRKKGHKKWQALEGKLQRLRDEIADRELRAL